VVLAHVIGFDTTTCRQASAFHDVAQREASLGAAYGNVANPWPLTGAGRLSRRHRRSRRGGGGRRAGGHRKAGSREVEAHPGADEAGADVCPREVGHALGDQGNQVTGGLAGIEQLVEGGVHLAVDEEAAPQLLQAVVAQVVLAQKRQQLKGGIQVLGDPNGPKQLLLDRHRRMGVVHPPLRAVGQGHPLHPSHCGVADGLVGPLGVVDVLTKALGLDEQPRRAAKQQRVVTVPQKEQCGPTPHPRFSN
jgi:hypothetical protein